MFTGRKRNGTTPSGTQQVLDEVRLNEFRRVYAEMRGAQQQFEEWMRVGASLVRIEIEHREPVTPEERQAFFEQFAAGIASLAHMITVFRKNVPVGTSAGEAAN